MRTLGTSRSPGICDSTCTSYRGVGHTELYNLCKDSAALIHVGTRPSILLTIAQNLPAGPVSPPFNLQVPTPGGAKHMQGLLAVQEMTQSRGSASLGLDGSSSSSPSSASLSPSCPLSPPASRLASALRILQPNTCLCWSILNSTLHGTWYADDDLSCCCTGELQPTIWVPCSVMLEELSTVVSTQGEQ